MFGSSRFGVFVCVVLLFGALPVGGSLADPPDAFEVWVLDQEGSAGELYIYDGKDVGDDAERATPDAVDLDGDLRTLCEASTGSTPVRAHMTVFSPDDAVGVISYVASGHVAFLRAADRSPIDCIDVGVQAHAAFPSPGGTYVTVANQNGKLLQRISTDADLDGVPYEDASDIELEAAATLDLANCTTPNGHPCEDPALRPDNAPICPVPVSDDRLVFVTMRGGGLFVVDATTTPMTIVAEYTKDAIGPNGCGGLQKDDTMYVNSGGPSFGHELYAVDLGGMPGPGAFNAPDTPAPTTIFDIPAPGHDGHGADLNEAMGGRYLWVADRWANTVEVVDTTTNTHVNTFDLESGHSSDPAPDGLFVAPGGDYAVASLRGPCPRSANDPSANNAVGATPGMGVIAIQRAGLTGKLVAVAPISNEGAPSVCSTRGDAPVLTERADPHGIVIRRTR